MQLQLEPHVEGHHTTCEPRGDGRYALSFGAEKSGTYCLRLLCNGLAVPLSRDGEGLPASSPASVRVVAAAPRGLRLQTTAHSQDQATPTVQMGAHITVYAAPVDAFGNICSPERLRPLALVASILSRPPLSSARWETLDTATVAIGDSDGDEWTAALASGVGGELRIVTLEWRRLPAAAADATAGTSGWLELRLAMGGTVRPARLFLTCVFAGKAGGEAELEQPARVQSCVEVRLQAGGPVASRSSLHAPAELEAELEAGGARLDSSSPRSASPRSSVDLPPYCLDREAGAAVLVARAGEPSAPLHLTLNDAWGNAASEADAASQPVQLSLLSVGWSAAHQPDVAAGPPALDATAERVQRPSGLLRHREAPSAPAHRQAPPRPQGASRFRRSRPSFAREERAETPGSERGTRPGAQLGVQAEPWTRVRRLKSGPLEVTFGSEAAGAYELHATLKGAHVQGSPLRVHVAASTPHALEARVPDHAPRSSEPFGPIGLRAVDAFGNPVPHGPLNAVLCDADCSAVVPELPKGRRTLTHGSWADSPHPHLAGASHSRPSRPASAGPMAGPRTARPPARRPASATPSAVSGSCTTHEDEGSAGSAHNHLSMRKPGSISATTTQSVLAPAVPAAVHAELLTQASRDGETQIYLRLEGAVGTCHVGVRESTGKLLGCRLALQLAAGPPHSLRATMHTGCIVRDRPFGPVKVWLVDGAGNPLSMGDVPLHLSVRPETREGGGEASCADIECELLSRCTRQPARALPPS